MAENVKLYENTIQTESSMDVITPLPELLQYLYGFASCGNYILTMASISMEPDDC